MSSETFQRPCVDSQPVVLPPKYIYVDRGIEFPEITSPIVQLSNAPRRFISARPVASMDSATGKIIRANLNELQLVRTKGVPRTNNGETLALGAAKIVKTCSFYPRAVKYSPEGHLVSICGEGDYTVYNCCGFREKCSGFGFDFVWSNSRAYAVKVNPSRIEIFDDHFQRKKVMQPTFLVEQIFGGAKLCVSSSTFACFYDWEDHELIQKIDLSVENVFWGKSGDMVAVSTKASFYVMNYITPPDPTNIPPPVPTNIPPPVPVSKVRGYLQLLTVVSEHVLTGIWVKDCFIYTNSARKLMSCIGGEVTTLFELDRTMDILGYYPPENTVYVMDNDFSIVGYTVLYSVIEYKTLVIRGRPLKSYEITLPGGPLYVMNAFCKIPIRGYNNADLAYYIWHTIPKAEWDGLARFLEHRGFLLEAMGTATDRIYSTRLAKKLGKFDLAEKYAEMTKNPELNWSGIPNYNETVQHHVNNPL